MTLKPFLTQAFLLFQTILLRSLGALQIIAIISLMSFLKLCPGLAEAAVATKEPEKAQVQTQIASETTVMDTLIYPSTVDSKINATINAEAEGLIKRIWVQVGSSVKIGQALITYENPDPVYKFAAVTVRAPVSGIVSSIDVSLMSKVEKGQKLLGLTDPRQLKIEIEIPAADLPLLKMGSQGQFRSQLNSEEYVDVKILGLAPLIDSHTGTAKATLEIISKATKNIIHPKSKLQLHPGMVGQVRFETNARQKILVPETAVLYRESKTWIRILENGKVKKILIELGPRHGDSLEVMQGLKNQSEYIVRTSRFIADGDDVFIDNPKSEEKAKDKIKEAGKTESDSNAKSL